ncbi:MAG: T9SS type A sorting domain-containing protein [Chitinophagaceae bacterium]|nr:T9SS type A sorting domain-containing protein [Chitinophagaceae bacterium]
MVPGVLSINHSTLTAPPTNTPRLDLYYYFYNWDISTGCESARTAVLATITTPPTASISYAASPYCSDAGTATVTQTGTVGGTYTASPAGLTINPATGAVTLGTSTPGTYTVTYTIPASGGCLLFSTTTSITVLNCGGPCSAITTIACAAATTATLAGAGSWSPGSCGFSTPGNERVYSFTPTVTGVYSLQVTSTNSGGFVDYFYKAASGGCSASGWTCIDDVFSPTTSTIGTLTAGVEYYILLDAEVTASVIHTFQVVCPAVPAPCTSIINIACGAPATATLAGAGSWSPGNCGFSTPGNERVYSFTPTVTGVYSLQVTSTNSGGFVDYFYKAASGGCSASGWTCIDDVFSPTTSTIGTLTAGVEYYILLDAEVTASVIHTFQVNCLCPDATIAYAGSPYCSNAGIATVTRTGTAGGTYSAAPAGLTLNAATGDVTLGTSTPGTYTVTYTIAPGACLVFTTTATITITGAPAATIVYTASPYCQNAGTANVTRIGTAGGTYTAAPAGLTINASTGAVTLGTSTPGTYTVTYTIAASGGCGSFTTTTSITVNPTPTAVASPSSQAVCSGTPITTIALSGGVAGTTYTWTRNNTGTVTGIAANGTGNISGTLTNTTNAPVIVTFTITPTANGCTGTAITATVTVNPIPNAVATPVTQTVCSGTPITTIALTGAVTGTTYAWTRNNTVNVTGIAANGTGNISGTLTNTTTGQQTVVFTITPTANGCAGTPITATVIVDKAPAITCPANITLPSVVGSCTAVVTYTPTVTGSPVPTLSYVLTGATSGSGSGSGSGTVFSIGVTTVTITATNTCGTATCSFTVTVTDSQLPVINVQPANRTVCTGSNVIFSVTAVTAPSAGGLLAYQWQAWNGTTWTNIAGATASTLNVNNVTVSMNTNSYRVQVTGLCTMINSAHASLYVNPLPLVNLATSIAPNLLPGQVLTITATTSPSGGSYVWFKDGQVIAGASGSTLPNLTVIDAGVYRVVYTDPNGCTSTSADITIAAQQSDNLYVYPVPNNGQFIVRYYNTANEQLNLRVIDAKGSLVYQSKILTTVPYSTINVDLRNGRVLASGIYIVEVRRADGRLAGSRRIVVY